MTATATPCPVWCATPGQDGHTCTSRPIRQDFGVRGIHADAIDTLATSLVDDPDLGHMLAVILNTASGFTLAPDQIRPVAMALLAHDALLLGDLTAAAYYRGEAQRGTVGAL